MEEMYGYRKHFGEYVERVAGIVAGHYTLAAGNYAHVAGASDGSKCYQDRSGG